jgi:hypothetical protein
VLSSLDLLAIPPFDTAHDHFGYRDRLSQPVIEGTDDVPTPGSGAPLKPGEFILGYPDDCPPSTVWTSPILVFPWFFRIAAGCVAESLEPIPVINAEKTAASP